MWTIPGASEDVPGYTSWLATGNLHLTVALFRASEEPVGAQEMASGGLQTLPRGQISSLSWSSETFARLPAESKHA